MRLIKISGHDLADDRFLARFADTVAEIAQTEHVIVVNGGGKSIKGLQAAFDIPEEKIDGLRVTSEKSLWITEMVMSADVNKRLVRALTAAGCDAFGMSGIDGQLMLAQKKTVPGGDLGFVGEVTSVRTDLIQRFLDWGLTPVISPVSADESGQHYNINADEAATAIAQACLVDQLDFVSNVPGVLRQLTDPSVIPTLTATDVNALIQEEIISGGMVPKVQAALAAIEGGVGQARIVDLDGLLSGGTLFLPEAEATQGS